jgi:hypothetical protein
VKGPRATLSRLADDAQPPTSDAVSTNDIHDTMPFKAISLRVLGMADSNVRYDMRHLDKACPHRSSVPGW